jgi:hypothetical protein
MKIEFNGPAVASFFLGGICGVIATLVVAAGPIGRIQVERDNGRATIERQAAQIQNLQAAIAAQQKPSAPAAASPLQLLDVVRPGLGMIAVAASNAIKADQAKRAAVAAQQAAGEQQALAEALQREQTEKHCPSGHCAACPDGWKLFPTPQETYCVPAVAGN